MDTEEVMEYYKRFVMGRDSLTQYGRHGPKERMAMEFKNVTDRYPLWPHPGYEKFLLWSTAHRVFSSATREPGALLDGWVEACYLAGRIPSPHARDTRVVCRADGISDKPQTYHVGFILADDSHLMSAYSQRDFLVGVLGEKNQFHMLYGAGQIADLRRHVEAQGGLMYMNMDMMALKSFSRGLCHPRTGFALKDFNAGTGSPAVYAGLHLPFMPFMPFMRRPSVTMARCPAWITLSAEKGWCMWHLDCMKIDFNEDSLSDELFDWPSVAVAADLPYDPTGVAPRQKVPCTHHVAKNTLGKLVENVHTVVGPDADEVGWWIKSIKWGVLLPPWLCDALALGWAMHHDLPPSALLELYALHARCCFP